MIKTNYHTHCTFCDGKDTPEAMVQAAIAANVSILGFSSHSMYPFSSDWHVASRAHGDYCEEIRRLARVYSGKLEILVGFEADYIAGVCSPRIERYREFAPDFLIGSVHFVPGHKGFFEADGNRQDTEANIRAYFKGNVREAVQAYFALQREMLRKGDFAILGHCDLIRKQNAPRNGTPLFDESDGWYRRELLATARAIASAGVCVEINTGGMARGYLATPYPSLCFLTMLRELRVPATITSDAHAADTLDFGFLQAVEHAKSAGYTELTYYTGGALKTQAIA